MCFKTLKNDFQHYPKPFYENFFGTPDCPRTVRGLFLINAKMCFFTHSTLRKRCSYIMATLNVERASMHKNNNPTLAQQFSKNIPLILFMA